MKANKVSNLLDEFMQFVGRMGLGNAPADKAWAEFNKANRLPEPPAEIMVTV